MIHRVAEMIRPVVGSRHKSRLAVDSHKSLPAVDSRKILAVVGLTMRAKANRKADSGRMSLTNFEERGPYASA